MNTQVIRRRTFKEEISTLRWWMFPFLLVIGFPCLAINYFSKSKWFCTFWGWHKAPNSLGFDGCSLKGTCPRCGEKVMQDSQGNWF